MNIIKFVIRKLNERKMKRIERMLNSTDKVEFHNGCLEVIKMIKESNETLKKLESK